jgi:hypothetical protein
VDVDNTINAGIFQHLLYLSRKQLLIVLENFEPTLALAREMNSPMTLADWFIRIGMTALYQGDIAQAQAYLEENWRQRQRLGSDMGIADSLCCLADLDFHEGGFDTAMQRVTESLQLWTDMVRVKRLAIINCCKGLPSVWRSSANCVQHKLTLQMLSLHSRWRR